MRVLNLREWWERGDDARREDERLGNVPIGASEAELRNGLDLWAHFADDLAELPPSQQRAAVAAAEDGYIEGRAAGDGQPAWLKGNAKEDRC